MKKLILIDGNALVHRVFHALPPLTSPQGLVVNAVYGFASILLKTIKTLKPDYLAAAFDLAGPTFRHEEFEEYKADRQKAPDELYLQIPLVKNLLRGFGIAVFEKEGFEADDLIGSVAEQAKKIADLQIIILTGDLDTLQLVDDEKVLVYTFRKGMTDTVLYNEKAVQDRFGLNPEQMTDFKGLKGDPSDNIPGVPGVGEKTACALLQKYGTLEKIYEAVEKTKELSTKSGKGEALTAKLAAKLKEFQDQAFFSKRLATIVREAGIDFSLAAADWRANLNPAKIETQLKELGFFSLIPRLAELGVLVPEVAPQRVERLSQKAAENEFYSLPGQRPSKNLLANHQANIIGHDLKPALKSWLEEGQEIKAQLFDTKIAAYLLNAGRRNYDFTQVFYVEFGRNGDPQSATDLRELRDHFWEKMKSADLLKVFEEIEMPLIKVLAEMELNGIKINAQQIEKLSREVEKQINQLEKKIYQLAGVSFNINSPQQLGEILFNKLQLRGKVRKTGGGAFSTAAAELEKLQDEHPIVELILQYRELQKIKNTYIDPFPALVNPTDQRLHTTYNQTGTATGRLSSQNPNLQNIPIRSELGQQFRAVFVADRGFDLVSFDYSQLELRIIAWLAQDQKMLEVFRRGEDIHTRTAAEIFEVAPEKVTANMRREAKALNFGLIYGMGVLGFARAAGVDKIRAREFITKYLNEFSGVARFMEKTKEEARKNGYVKTFFGRRRELPEILSSMPQLAAQAERMAINAPIQGTGADIMKLAMNQIYNYLHQNRSDQWARLLLQVHDELLCEIKEGESVRLAGEFKKIMEAVWDVGVPLAVDVKKGKNWSEMTKI